MKKTYEELEGEAKVLLSQISELELKWEGESDPEKLAKLESKIDRLETRKDKTYTRMDTLSESEGEKDDKKDKEEEEPEDEYICTDCGGDLKEISDGLLECVNCGEVYEEEEE